MAIGMVVGVGGVFGATVVDPAIGVAIGISLGAAAGFAYQEVRDRER